MIDLLTGNRLPFPTEEERALSRIKRMRVRVWYGICGLAGLQETTKGRLIMYTLTYKSKGAWKARHVSGFAVWLRAEGCQAYVWVAELQKRGAVHYHVLALMPAGYVWVKPTKKDGAWGKGFTWVTPDVVRPFYIMKYLQKGVRTGKKIKFPKGIRLYGVSRSALLGLTDKERRLECLSKLPAWFRNNEAAANSARDFVRVHGGVDSGGRLCFTPYGDKDVATVEVVWYAMRGVWRSNSIALGKYT